jgi:phosphoenolpyruvate carboxylase
MRECDTWFPVADAPDILPEISIVHNRRTMPPLWKPENWSARLAELEARTGDLKEAPLRRDVRSLGMLLGDVLREQAGEDLYRDVEQLRQAAIRRREAQSSGRIEEAELLMQTAVFDVDKLSVDQAYQLTRAFAFYFELINLAETNHRKRRRLSIQAAGDATSQRGSLRGTLREMKRVGISNRNCATLGHDQAPANR